MGRWLRPGSEVPFASLARGRNEHAGAAADRLGARCAGPSDRSATRLDAPGSTAGAASRRCSSAEFVVWLGFGGLLPVLPLYFTQQGIDLATLGLVIAAWPAARLVSEPIFGWLADRTARVPLMVIGLVATGVFGALPLVFTGPLAFLLLRAGAGLGGRHLRPGRPRLPDRRDAAGATRRGVRAVRRGADGRPAARPGDRRIRGGAVRRHRLRVRLQRGRRGLAAAIGDRAAVREESGERTHPAPSPDSTDSRPTAPSIHATRRPATIDADRDRPADRGGTDAPAEPRPDRGAHHQCRRLLRGRHVRGHLESVPRAPRRGPRAHRADVRDVRAAGPRPLAVRRSPRRPARLAARSSSSDRSCRRSPGSLYTLISDPTWPSRSSSSRRPGSRSSTPPSTRSSPRTRRPAGRPPRRACSAPPGRSASSSRR